MCRRVLGNVFVVVLLSSVMAGGGTHEHGLSGGDALALTRAAGRGRGVKRSIHFSRESSRDDC